MSVTVTVNGQSGPTISAKTGDQVGVTVGGSGAYAVSVSQAGTPGGQGIQGPQGPPSTTITVGKVETLSPGANATVTSSSSNSGANLTLNFGLPAGQTGATGAAGTTPSFSIGTVSTLAAGSSANVTLATANGGADVTLSFGVPRGADGDSGVSLSSLTPSNLGTAAAGVSCLASRSDHVHSLPVISYANLTGTPSNFPTNATLVSGLSSATVSSVNNLTGALTLAAGSNVTLTSNGSTLTLSSVGGLGENDAVDGDFYEGYIPANTITITTQPSPQTASGGAATFSVVASSSPGGTLSYQWQRQDGGFGEFVAIVGATGASLVLSDLLNTVDDGDRYRVVVSSTNAVSVTSDSALLTVAANTITITTQPTNQTASSGSATFTAAATVAPSGTPSYQWQRSADAGVTWANVSGATSSTLALSGLTAASDGGARFRVVVSAVNALSVTSNAATLTVESDNTITITSQPTNQLAINGAAEFAVAATVSPSGTPSYQWQRSGDAGVSWANVQGATSSTLSLSGLTVAADNGARFRVVVSAANAPSVTSASATLTVPQITITTQPTNQTASNGSATFSAAASTTGAASVAYQWQKLDAGGSTWASVSGATSSTLALSGLTQAADHGDQYRVVASSADATSVTSNGATLSVQDIVISSQPSDQTASGGSATFSITAAATGSAALGYQWQASDDLGDTWTNISGATASSLTLSSLAGNADGRQCRVLVSSSGLTSVTSSTASLSVPSLLFAWGTNLQGQLGDGTQGTKTAPIQIGVSRWKRISAGYRFTHAIRDDGTLWAWGNNSGGALGDGTETTRLSPVQVSSASWRSVVGGNNVGAAIRSDGTLWAWGYRVGDGTTTTRLSPVQIGESTWRSVAAGWAFRSAIRSDGTLWAWGDNSAGQVKFPTSNFGEVSPVQISSDAWRSVGCGSQFTLAIKQDRTLWAWGANTYGQLGDGTTTSRGTLVQVSAASWRSVVAGDYHTIAIREDGTLWTWGRNNVGQLGDGTTTDRLTPVQIGSESWVAIDAGASHSIAVRSDNTLWAWGNNNSGALGDGTTTNRLAPVQIGSSIWQAVQAGNQHTIALLYSV